MRELRSAILAGALLGGALGWAYPVPAAATRPVAVLAPFLQPAAPGRQPAEPGDGVAAPAVRRPPAPPRPAATAPARQGGRRMAPRVPEGARTGGTGVAGTGRLHRVQPGDTLWGLARRYGVDPTLLARWNGLDDPDWLLVGQVLRLGPASGPGELPALVWPVAGSWRITSPFGWRWGRLHTGVDIAAPVGTPVRAVLPGVVEFAGWAGGYGRLVVLRHAGEWRSYYAHLSRVEVAPGQSVAAGEVIGRVGSTGHSTGPHVHLELRRGRQPVDPLPWLSR